MAAGVFHFCPDVVESIGAALGAKLILDAGDRMAEAVTERPLAGLFLHADRNLQLRLREGGVAVLGEIHHVTVLRIAEPPAGVSGDWLAAFAGCAAARMTVRGEASGKFLFEQSSQRDEAHPFGLFAAGWAFDTPCRFRFGLRFNRHRAPSLLDLVGMLVLPNHRSTTIIDVAPECKVKATLTFFSARCW